MLSLTVTAILTLAASVLIAAGAVGSRGPLVEFHQTTGGIEPGTHRRRPGWIKAAVSFWLGLLMMAGLVVLGIIDVADRERQIFSPYSTGRMMSQQHENMIMNELGARQEAVAAEAAKQATRQAMRSQLDIVIGEMDRQAYLLNEKIEALTTQPATRPAASSE